MHNAVLLCPQNNYLRASGMPKYTISFDERETLPDLLEERAKELDLTVEQLIKRFILVGMRDYKATPEQSILGTSLEDYLIKNGVLKPKN